MIVVAVTKDDGKVVRFPYSADRSMAQLINDVEARVGTAPVASRVVETVEPIAVSVPVPTLPIPTLPTLNQNGKIQKEDLVTCVKVHDRGKGATVDIVVGGIYRVLKVNMNGPNVSSYDIIDDTDYHKADIPRRILAYPDEIQFLEKRKTPIKKEIGKFEQTKVCDKCIKQYIQYRNDNGEYQGECPDCGV